MSVATGTVAFPIPASDDRLWPPRRYLYPVDEAAVLIGISSKSTWNLINAGKLATRWSGNRRLVPAKEIERYVASCPTEKPDLSKADA